MLLHIYLILEFECNNLFTMTNETNPFFIKILVYNKLSTCRHPGPPARKSPGPVSNRRKNLISNRVQFS